MLELLHAARQLHASVADMLLPSEAELTDPSHVSVLPFLWSDAESSPQRMALTSTVSGLQSFSFMGV